MSLNPGSPGLQTVQSACCSHRAILSTELPFTCHCTGRAGTKACREEKGTMRASHLPGKGGKSSFLPQFQAGILSFVTRSQFSVAEPTPSSCRMTKIALKVCGAPPQDICTPISTSCFPSPFPSPAWPWWCWDAETVRVAPLQPSPTEHTGAGSTETAPEPTAASEHPAGSPRYRATAQKFQAPLGGSQHPDKTGCPVL